MCYSTGMVCVLERVAVAGVCRSLALCGVCACMCVCMRAMCVCVCACVWCVYVCMCVRCVCDGHAGLSLGMQAEIDATRARRAFEAAQRAAREQDLVAAAKAKGIQDELKRAREEQRAQKVRACVWLLLCFFPYT